METPEEKQLPVTMSGMPSPLKSAVATATEVASAANRCRC
jgi:hypothetical protein